ncbi:MAG: GNAT family N-acetyltransferase [Ignavibacteriaceae bacterium]|nr:GNAT family N-acetyltransferase [Ignavibacteriaceae bacterium]
MKYDFMLASTEMLGVLLTLMKEFYDLEQIKFYEEKLTKAVALMLGNRELGRIFLIKYDDEFVGYSVVTFGFSLEFFGRDALIDEIYVRENFRGKGIGSRLLKFIENLCREEKIYALHLEVNRINTKAQDLYRRMGYKDHNRYLLTKWLQI